MESISLKLSELYAISLLLLIAPTAGFSSTYPNTSDVMQINMVPSDHIDVTTKSLQISCLPQENKAIKEILLIQLSKNSRDEIIFADIRGGTDPSSGSNPNGSLKGASNIDKNIAMSYLNITMSNPTQDDCGVYICTMYFVDENNLIKIDSVSSKISWDRSEGFLKRLLFLEAQIQHQSSQLREQSKLITHLQMKENKPVAFHASVTMSSHKGRIILPTMSVQEGKGYDPKSGLFTAPTDGLYTFYLAASPASYNFVRAQIKVNGKIIARFNAGDEKWASYASADTVTMLRTGDIVEAVIAEWQRVANVTFYFLGYRISKT